MAAPAGAVAKPGYFVTEPERRAVFTTQGSDGYRVKVEAVSGRHQRGARVYVTARKGPASVQYMVRGARAGDDSIDVRLPHIGRISVEFMPLDVTHGRVPDNCKGRRSRVEHGYFRGTIRLRGEREFTVVRRASAPGRIVQSYRQVCDNEEGVDGGKGPRFSSRLLFTGPEKGSSGVSFEAYESEFGKTIGGPSFSAHATRFRERMAVFSSVDVEGDPGQFTTPEAGAPKVAEVEPPSPFEGTATFRLTGSKTSTWEGDLAVELPGLGKVSLAGPSFWSVYCQDLQCTETAPPNVSLVIARFSGSG